MFKVHLANGRIRNFVDSSHGLYYSDYSKHKEEATVLVNSVDFNKTKYSKRNYLHAVEDRLLQHIIGGPSFKYFCNIVKNNQLRNCPVTVEDIIDGEDIFGKILKVLKGRKNRLKPLHSRVYLERIPPIILLKYKYVQGVADVMLSMGSASWLVIPGTHISPPLRSSQMKNKIIYFHPSYT